MDMKIETKKMGRWLVVLLLLFAVSVPLAALGVSYPPPLYHRAERHDTYNKGDVLYLFHSGTDDVKKAVHVNDKLSVFRVTSACEVVPIGLLKVVSFVGDTYIKGEVFAGEIKPDDIAKKGKVSFLVVSAGTCSQ